jgi:alpha-D-ribose 1-methylphosphonate 5-triphosphate synthase subunit PhnH
MSDMSLAFESQSAFRALMDATARPGTIKTLRGKNAPAPLLPAAAAVIASLADYETPVWLDAALRDAPAVADWIRFTTGAPLIDDPRQAAFALIADARAMPDFAGFAQGSEEYPDRSTTLIVQIERFAGESFSLSGPGLKDTRAFAAEPLPAEFAERCAANRETYPRGIDLILVASDRIAALPRSVRISRKT